MRSIEHSIEELRSELLKNDRINKPLKNLSITRTVGSISLSHFLSRRGGIWPRIAGFPHFVRQLRRAPLRYGSSRNLPSKAGLLNFCSCTQDKFVITYTAIALLLATNLVTGDKFAALIKLVPLTMLRMSGLSARHPDAPSGRSGSKT